MKKIAPSILSADFTRLGEEIKAVAEAGADWIHVDIMDGHFVPNLTLGPLILEAVRRATALPLDVHLMIEHPERYIPEFAAAGADHLYVQVEACVHLHRAIQMIKTNGAKAGAVLNPATSLSALDWVLENLDLVLVMGVNPGFGGQVFIPAVLSKIRALKETIERRDLAIEVVVDGGVNPETIASIAGAGADVLVAGSAVFGSTDYHETLRLLRETAGAP
jgi:ribulose-phosphate 3-epimerase